MPTDIDDNDLLAAAARQLGDVSADWATRIEVPANTERLAFASRERLGTPRALGVELIREGWLLHQGRSRLAPTTRGNLALLMGDWCYAAGLCHITEHGSLSDVRALAQLIAELATRPGAAEQAAADDARWVETERHLEGVHE